MKLVLGVPNEKQRLFFAAKNRYVAYGGARGGGKSWAVRRKSLLLALRYGGIKILIVRRSYGELRENHIRPLVRDTKGVAVYKEMDKSLAFLNGSMIFFGFCGCVSDVDRYQGMEFDVIFLDEATHFPEEVFDALKVCIRGVNDIPKRFYLTCNPGGVGHGWVKRLFIDRNFREGEKGEDYVFIKATVFDNKALLKQDPAYVEQLKALPPQRRRAWLDGDWDVFSGQFFGEFDWNVHVIKPCGLRREWTRIRVFDYGLDRLACLWIALDGMGRAYVYDELCVSNLIVSEAARRILSHNGDEVFCTLAPADLWGRSQESGRSRAEIFAACGLVLTMVKSERIGGWFNVREWLKVVVNEKGERDSRLKIFENCEELIRCLPAVQFAKGGVEDVATEPHDLTHVVDALRYFCAWRPVAADFGCMLGQDRHIEIDDEDEEELDFFSYGGEE